ncbi:MAG TPA: hypothetical protein PK079_03300 [Leptospiraceae bacterium]|nr:hypothetical protein [Leptospiraceae bacterium]HMW03780.1 hypothetical protein [Leptospiraceae bacterium]HMX34262.1 hypothetical protein [Leptospiraceae bacterium]HMY29760.1 hypothetical protein [Leptospiraceae bacterium]HMZ62841.1 hypothetical protein [Leptospiraceae bacterium]
MNKKKKVVVVALLMTVGNIQSIERYDKKPSKDLKELANELNRSPDPYSEKDKYKSLCDKDGYPLVGNTASKGDIPPRVEKKVYLKVQEFCKTK